MGKMHYNEYTNSKKYKKYNNYSIYSINNINYDDNKNNTDFLLNNNNNNNNNNDNDNNNNDKINKNNKDKNNDKNEYIEGKIGEMHWIRGELLGVGAYGKVYKGFVKKSKKMIAIKQIDINTTINKLNDDEMDIIDREAEIMKSLKHDNIVQFYGYTKSTKHKCLYIIMEYISGGNIEVLYNRNGPFTEKTIKSYTKQILSALNYAHSKKIIHRDIKGKNILINKENIAKLADFGSAKITSTTFGNKNNIAIAPSVNYNYTPLWLAPEVLLGQYNNKIDIWALGCVMIEMASGKYPWDEKKFENPFTALYHIGHSEEIPKIPKSLSKNCQSFILSCLKRDTNKRLSADQLLNHEFLDE